MKSMTKEHIISRVVDNGHAEQHQPLDKNCSLGILDCT